MYDFLAHELRTRRDEPVQDRLTLTLPLPLTLTRLNPSVGRDAMQLGVGVGDQVIQLTNDYENLVFNGDIGRVTAVRPGR